MSRYVDLAELMLTISTHKNRRGLLSKCKLLWENDTAYTILFCHFCGLGLWLPVYTLHHDDNLNALGVGLRAVSFSLNYHRMQVTVEYIVITNIRMLPIFKERYYCFGMVSC